MKEIASNQIEAVWAYLHGEMADEERNAFELDLQKDAELRRIFDETSKMHRLLRETLPVVDQEESSIDDIADKALACWEKEYDLKQRFVSERASQQKQGGLPSKWSRFLFHPAVGVAGLAAAAVILLVSPVLKTPAGLAWDDPVFSSLALRGAQSAEAQAVLSEDIAVRCQTLLQSELMRALETRADSSQISLVLSLHLQELRNGAFSLIVQARTRKGDLVGEWSGDYSGEAAFNEQVGASAEQIAEALASCTNAVKGK